MYLIIVFIFILTAAFFAGIETALITSNPLTLYGKIKDKKKVKSIMSLYSNIDFVINTVLIGTNISVVSAAIFFTFFFQQWYSFTQAMVYSTTILTFVMLFLSEILPKAYSLKHSTGIITRLTPLVKFFMFLFYPISILLRSLSRLILRKGQDSEYFSREEVTFLFQKEQSIKKYDDEVDFIYRVLKLSETKAKEVMIPINEIIAIPVSANRKTIDKRIKDQYYSRLPVYKDQIFNLIGYIPTKEFLFYPDRSVNDLMRETLFFPETKPADEVLFEMQKEKRPLVFLVDEYGAISGMITKEDVVEAIVGNIEDEIHQEDPLIIMPGAIVVPGFEDVDLINEKFLTKIKKNDFETMSGFVSYILRKIPEVGDHFEHNGDFYKVLEVENRMADKIKISGRRFP